MADVFHRNFFLAGPAGRLEAMLWTSSAADPDFAAVVCHPHPLFGGTMHNKVVFQTAKALHDRGAPVLRFNFRGTGQSEGEHDPAGRAGRCARGARLSGGGFPGQPLLLAGFSFGSLVGLRVGARMTASRLIGLGLPVDNVDLSFLQACAKPKLVLQGGNDQFGSRANIEALFATLPEPKRLVIVDGADHFSLANSTKSAGRSRRGSTKRHPGAALPSQVYAFSVFFFFFFFFFFSEKSR